MPNCPEEKTGSQATQLHKVMLSMFGDRLSIENPFSSSSLVKVSSYRSNTRSCQKNPPKARHVAPSICTHPPSESVSRFGNFSRETNSTSSSSLLHPVKSRCSKFDDDDDDDDVIACLKSRGQRVEHPFRGHDVRF
jgi:hypothetical protein